MAGAGAVFEHHRLLPLLRKRSADGTPRVVGGAAGRKQDHRVDRLGKIGDALRARNVDPTVLAQPWKPKEGNLVDRPVCKAVTASISLPGMVKEEDGKAG